MSKREWEVALDPWIATERERLGGRPTAEEIAAYRRGQLNDEENDRVRALLVYNPDLTPLLLTDDEKRTDLKRYIPLGAGVLIALVSIPRWFQRAEPFVYEARHTLEPLHARGVAEPPIYDLPAGREQYLLTLLVSADYAQYRVEIVRDGDVIWTGKATARDGAIELSIPGKLLRKEADRIDVYGTDANGERRIDSYRVRIKAQGSE